MNITIIGGGNLGSALAGELATKGHTVILHTSKASIFRSQIRIVEDRREYDSKSFTATDDLKYALCHRRPGLIIVTVPANGLGVLSERMSRYVQPESVILFMPGIGGVEYMFSQYIRRGITLLGMQRIPAVYRVVEPGAKVRVSGKRKSGLFIGGIPSEKAEQYAGLLSELFDMPCVAMPNYLNVTLTPSNPILHTSRLYSMFSEYRPGVFYDRNIFFYQEWNDQSSEILLECDEELQNLISQIPELDLSYVKSLKEHYESNTAEEMTYKISHIASFRGITSPMLEIEQGKWIPDFNSRYFTADFPYGLAIIKGLADIFVKDVPAIDQVLRWYSKTVGQEYYINGSFTGCDLNNTGIPQRYGYKTRKDILAIYI